MTEMVFLCPSLSLCLYQCCKTVLLNKIISSDKDLIGLVLFGTVSVTLGHINLIVSFSSSCTQNSSAGGRVFILFLLTS